jgi:hypothetical protein
MEEKVMAEAALGPSVPSDLGNGRIPKVAVDNLRQTG